MTLINKLSIALPSWIKKEIDSSATYTTDEDKATVTLNLARLNVENKTGGPFGAAIFNEENGELISVGVNCVIPSNCSVAHAEIMAIALAQVKLDRYRLDMDTKRNYVLATSAQPCAMCFGAIPWAGISKLICGARGEDVENIIGFDEGPLHPDWVAQLTKRGIKVVRDVLRNDVCRVLESYKETDGTIY